MQLEARRRAGRGHVPLPGRSGAAPWCRTICETLLLQRQTGADRVCRLAKVLRHPLRPGHRRPTPSCGWSGAAWPGAASVDGTGVGRYLVDPASSHMLVSRIKPCMSKYKHLYRETANGSLKQLWFIWWFLCYLDNRSNSRANTCTKSGSLGRRMRLLDTTFNTGES